MLWQVAAGVIIGGACLGLLWAGIMMLIETPQDPDDVKGVVKLGIFFIIAGLAIAAFTLAMGFRNL
jgi:hypothetical protein